MKKAFLSVILVCCLLLNFEIIASASETAWCWNNVAKITHDITFSRNVGTYSALIEGNKDVMLIIANAKLFYKNGAGNWIDTEIEWRYNETSDRLSISETFSATPGKEYKVILTAIVYQDEGEAITETIVKEY